MYNFSVIDDSWIHGDKNLFSTHFDEEIELETLEECGEFLTRFHSSAVLTKDKRRKSSAVYHCSFLQWDFDSGITVDDIINRIGSYDYLITASKNHMKDKGDGKGIVPRFHLYIPISPNNINKEYYRFLVDHFSKKWGIDNEKGRDKACSDIIRYFFRAREVIDYREEGISIKVDSYRNLYENTIQSELFYWEAKNALKKKSGNDRLLTPDEVRTKIGYQNLIGDLQKTKDGYNEILRLIGYIKRTTETDFETALNIILQDSGRFEKMKHKSKFQKVWNSQFER